MDPIQEAMQRVQHDGGVVLLAIGAVSVIAWFLLFIKWLQIRTARMALKEESKESVQVNRQVLIMWVNGEYGRLNEGMGPIEASAALMPLLGLLGTVLGMLQTFDVIQIEGTGDPRLMAEGIRKALLTTQAGILSALPVLVGLRFLSSRCTRLAASIELSLYRRANQSNAGLAQ